MLAAEFAAALGLEEARGTYPCWVSVGKRADGEIAAMVVDSNGLGLSFEQLVFRHDALAHLDLARRLALAQAISKRVTYLLEQVAPIEADSRSGVVQLRSMPPDPVKDGVRYYELLVAGEIKLCRYEKLDGTKLKLVPATVTREVFSKLVTDCLLAIFETAKK